MSGGEPGADRPPADPGAVPPPADAGSVRPPADPAPVRPPADAGARRLPGDPPSPWEERYGFSRIVRVGEFVLVGGTTSVGPGGSVLGQTAYEQTAEILHRIEHELSRAGASLGDVVQTRVYVTDISLADEIGRAHADALGQVRPLMTMVEVSALIDPRMLVEIETVAHLGAGS